MTMWYESNKIRQIWIRWALVNHMNEMDYDLKEMIEMDYGLKKIKMKCDEWS